MKLSRERLAAWILAVVALVVMLASAVLMILNPTTQDPRYWEYLSGAVFGTGAPILGLIILAKQGRNRIGWLWLVFGLAIAFFSLAQVLKFQANSTLIADYPAFIFVMLLFSETAYIVRFICMILMILWFPDGDPPSPRWRILYKWAMVSFFLLIVGYFAQKVPWSYIHGFGGEAPLVDNPIGFLPVSLIPFYDLLSMLGFISILFMSVLVILVMLRRYRSASPLVRAQLQWFVVGGVVYVISLVVSVILIDYSTFLPGILTNLAILPFYLAVGIAITRYRLYEIDVIIRKTLQYALLTGLLALAYFGSVISLQNLTENLFSEQSPLVIVLSTLAIAAMFTPLRARIQDFIDRRFYRQKYDAEKALAQFAATTRNEVNLDNLTASMLSVVEETLQPEQVSLWLKKEVTRK